MGISGKFACVFRASATICRTGVKVVECSAEVDTFLVSYRFCPCFSQCFFAHGIYLRSSMSDEDKKHFSCPKSLPLSVCELRSIICSPRPGWYYDY